jgi:nucleoside-diphosphate-sugar epimerase
VDEVEFVQSPEFGAAGDWSRALRGVDIVIHLSARVHVMHDVSRDPLTEFLLANTATTDTLARQAASAGVKRFVYLSSIKVNGEETETGRPFRVDDRPRPADPYAVSKHEAERILRDVARETRMEVVTIRPPLIYGPGVGANFRRMMSWLKRGVPLPFAAIHNRRTLVGLDNVVDLIVTCMFHLRAANEVFLAGDAEDLSTPALLTRLGLALGTPARLIPLPPPLLRLGLSLLGQGDAAQRLCGSLQIDISRARDVLGWNPPSTVDEGLRKTAADFLEHSHHQRVEESTA